MIKKQFWILNIFLIVILIANIHFVFSEQADISSDLGFNEGVVIISDLDMVGYEKTDSGATITFKGGDITLNKNEFTNIKSQDEAKLPSFIKLNEKGEIINAEFTVNEIGGNYIFGNTKFYAPPNSRVLFDEKTGIQVKVEKDAEIKEMPTSLNNPGLKNYLTTIESAKDGSFKLSNGVKVHGRLGFDKDGQAFMQFGDEGRPPSVNGVSISPTPISSKIKINMFFDGQEHDGSYISVNDQNLIFSLGKQETAYDRTHLPIQIESSFNQNNPYIKVDASDTFAIGIGMESKIEIVNRDSQGLIPKITTNGDFSVYEDSKEIRYKKGDLYMQSFRDDTRTTSPVEITMNDKNGNLLFNGNRVFVDNFNRFVLSAPPDAEEFGDFQDLLNTKFSSRISYNYPTKESVEKLLGIKINYLSAYNEPLPKGYLDTTLGRLRDYMETLTPETRTALNAIGEIQIADSSYFRKISGDDPFAISAIGLFLPNEDYTKSKIIYKVDRTSLLEYGLFRHEMAHLFADSIKRKDNSFERQWRKIYGISGSRFDRTLNSWEYKDNSDPGTPKNGFVTPYGGSSLHEDIATFVENMGNPEIFASVVNPSSPQYDIRYRQKLDMLHQYKFISDDEYNKIFEVAGIK
ncbi:MAG: hypothetical protein AABX28_01130 [Nanoarchaeota archaeon]